MEEEWKTIDGFDGKYQVSNLGNVRGMFSPKRYKKKKLDIHTIKQFDNGCGYLSVRLYIDGKMKNKLVHRLVAEAFCKRENEEDVCVNHKDYNRHNNRVDNLEWCTYSRNAMYSSCHFPSVKKNSKKTNTGEKYICHSDGRFFVSFQSRICNIKRSFRTMGEAASFRDKIVKEFYG